VARVRFDPDVGRLQLDRRTFTALVAATTRTTTTGVGQPTGREGGEPLQGLRAAGVLVGQYGSDLHPMLRPAFQAIARPTRRLLLGYLPDGGREAHAPGWIDDRCAVLLVDRVGFGLAPGSARQHIAGAMGGRAPTPSGAQPIRAVVGSNPEGEPECELLTVDPSFVPAALARLIGLGRRPPLGPARTPPPPLMGWTTAHLDGEPAHRDIVPGMSAVIRWSQAPESTGERLLRLERPGNGDWSLATYEDSAQPATVTPTQVWLALVEILAPPGQEAESASASVHK
jgi:hypothetical protein